MIDNLSQMTAQGLADLQTKQLEMLISGELSPDHLDQFLSLSKESREKLLSINSFVLGGITKEQLRWFISLAPEKREQLLIIMPPPKEEILADKRVELSIPPKAEKFDGGIIKEEKSALVQIKENPIPIIMRDTPFLKLVSGNEKLIIKAFDFSETKKNGVDIFEATGFEDCEKLKSNKSKEPVRPKIPVCVYELLRDATYSEIFGSVGVGLSRLCFTREQIRNFCLKHSVWISTDGYPVFFLFVDDGNYFVAKVLINEDGMRITEDEFSYEAVWSASGSRRVVLPDLNSLEL